MAAKKKEKKSNKKLVFTPVANGISFWAPLPLFRRALIGPDGLGPIQIETATTTTKTTTTTTTTTATTTHQRGAAGLSIARASLEPRHFSSLASDETATNNQKPKQSNQIKSTKPRFGCTTSNGDRLTPAFYRVLPGFEPVSLVFTGFY